MDAARAYMQERLGEAFVTLTREQVLESGLLGPGPLARRDAPPPGRPGRPGARRSLPGAQQLPAQDARPAWRADRGRDAGPLAGRAPGRPVTQYGRAAAQCSPWLSWPPERPRGRGLEQVGMDERRVAHVIRETRPGSSERVLVVVMNNARDWEIVREQAWYRIPVKRAPRRVGADYLAFYFTGAFPRGPAASGHLLRSDPRLPPGCPRRRCFPTRPAIRGRRTAISRSRSAPWRQLPRPIPSHKLRRITFISTSLYRLLNADEITDLWEKERRQDELWAMLQHAPDRSGTRCRDPRGRGGVIPPSSLHGGFCDPLSGRPGDRDL